MIMSECKPGKLVWWVVDYETTRRITHGDIVAIFQIGVTVAEYKAGSFTRLIRARGRNDFVPVFTTPIECYDYMKNPEKFLKEKP